MQFLSLRNGEAFTADEVLDELARAKLLWAPGHETEVRGQTSLEDLVKADELESKQFAGAVAWYIYKGLRYINLKVSYAFTQTKSYSSGRKPVMRADDAPVIPILGGKPGIWAYSQEEMEGDAFILGSQEELDEDGDCEALVRVQAVEVAGVGKIGETELLPLFCPAD